MARWAYRDLVTHFVDEKNGGFYWSISFAGEPLDTRKVIYGEVFGIYALSEFYRATGEKAALDRAIAVYRLVEEHAHDHVNRGYYEEFTADWKPSTGRSALGATGAKSQTVHIHMRESSTNLRRVWPATHAGQRRRRLSRRLVAPPAVLGHHVAPDLHQPRRRIRRHGPG